MVKNSLQVYITLVIRSNNNEVLKTIKNKFKINASVFSQLILINNTVDKTIIIQKGIEYIFGNKFNKNYSKLLEILDDCIVKDN